MCNLPPGIENRCVPKLWGGGGLQRILWHQPGGGGHQRGQWETLRGRGGEEWDKNPGGILGGEYDGTNTRAASPGGGGANTLVQPHYPTATNSVNLARARGGKARDSNQGETGGWDSKEM